MKFSTSAEAGVDRCRSPWCQPVILSFHLQISPRLEKSDSSSAEITRSERQSRRCKTPSAASCPKAASRAASLKSPRSQKSSRYREIVVCESWKRPIFGDISKATDDRQSALLLHAHDRVAEALLLHQPEQHGGVRRMQPDAAVRGPAAKLRYRHGAVDGEIAVVEDRIRHGRVAVEGRG